MLLESGAKVFNGISIVVGVLWVVEVLDAISKAELGLSFPCAFGVNNKPQRDRTP